MSDVNKVNQSGASGEKIIGRDSCEITHLHGKKTHIEELVAILEREIEREETRDGRIESLQFFDEPFTPDGITAWRTSFERRGGNPQ